MMDVKGDTCYIEEVSYIDVGHRGENVAVLIVVTKGTFDEMIEMRDKMIPYMAMFINGYFDVTIGEWVEHTRDDD